MYIFNYNSLFMFPPTFCVCLGRTKVSLSNRTKFKYTQHNRKTQLAFWIEFPSSPLATPFGYSPQSSNGNLYVSCTYNIHWLLLVSSCLPLSQSLPLTCPLSSLFSMKCLCYQTVQQQRWVTERKSEIERKKKRSKISLSVGRSARGFFSVAYISSVFFFFASSIQLCGRCKRE